ncbi:MAG: hypothetical protein KGH87_02400 [Thaumarchaeota archaeon]|nr:hypothetical protein [Nitrososphaerota archaeon]
MNRNENKIHDLIIKSATPHNFVNQLGKRKVNVVNEKDYIKVFPKNGWKRQLLYETT